LGVVRCFFFVRLAPPSANTCVPSLIRPHHKGTNLHNLRGSHFLFVHRFLRRYMGTRPMGRHRRDITSEKSARSRCQSQLHPFGFGLLVSHMPVSLFSPQASVPDKLLLSDLAAPYPVDSGRGNANLGTKVFHIWGSM